MVTLMDSMQTLSANHNRQTTSKQLQWGNDNKNVFKNGYRTKERQTQMTCLNFREISNARVYMLCLVCMICNSGIMANSQWLRPIRLIFHLQANTKMKVDLEWCWFKKKRFFCDVQQVLQQFGTIFLLLQVWAFFLSKRSYYLVQNWPFLGWSPSQLLRPEKMCDSGPSSRTTQSSNQS